MFVPLPLVASLIFPLIQRVQFYFLTQGTMNNKEITNKSKQTVDELFKRVSEMSKEEFERIVDSMANFYEYSTYNQILLSEAGCSQVASFRKWKELGRYIVKGGRATWILAPTIIKRKIKNEQTGEDEEQKIVKGFVSVPVFDISQTKGKEIQKNMTTRADLKIDLLINVAENLGYTVSYKAFEIACGGYITGKSIVLNSNLNEVENVGTLIHELSHGELGHTQSNDISSRSLKEQQAETATAIISKIFGIDRKSDFYLKSWRLDENIKKSFSKVNRTVQNIVKEIKGIKKVKAVEKTFVL